MRLFQKSKITVIGRFLLCMLVALVILTGCESGELSNNQTDQSASSQMPSAKKSERFARVSSQSYSNKEVDVLRDTKTEKEFLVVSYYGYGVSVIQIK